MKRRLTELWLMLTCDPKKASALGALLLVAALMWARLSLRGAGPNDAEASATADAIDSSIEGFTDLEAPSDHSSRAVTLEAPEPALARDLFALDEDFFPKSSQTDLAALEAPKSAGGTVETPKRDERATREALERQIRELASGFRLRSTIVGSEPIAVIHRSTARDAEASVLRIGETIDGFSLVEVHRGRAVIERSGIRVELRLALPGSE